LKNPVSTSKREAQGGGGKQGKVVLGERSTIDGKTAPVIATDPMGRTKTKGDRGRGKLASARGLHSFHNSLKSKSG